MKLSIYAKWGLWLRSLGIGVALMIIELGYIFLAEGDFNLRAINRSVAGASVLLITISLALSGITYFTDKLDKYIVYRRYIGVMGALFAIAHMLLTFIDIGSMVYLIEFFTDPAPFTLFAIASTLLLILLTIISNNESAKLLGNIWWRRLLRLGYVALLFGFLHFALMRQRNWQLWFESPDELPPTSLLLVIPVALTFLIRLILAIALKLKKKN